MDLMNAPSCNLQRRCNWIVDFSGICATMAITHIRPEFQVFSGMLRGSFYNFPFDRVRQKRTFHRIEIACFPHRQNSLNVPVVIHFQSWLVQFNSTDSYSHRLFNTALKLQPAVAKITIPIQLNSVEKK